VKRSSSEGRACFSGRVPLHAPPNALTRALADRRARGEPVIDLTESNPTRVDIEYAAELVGALADARALRYEPHPFGLLSAREAVAADCARRGAVVQPADVVLSASTSESYSWLFKLLCNPGESVLVPRPSYPLFEHLTRLEGIRAIPYHLDYHGRWEIDFSTLAAAPADARAVLVVSPNNPTGSFVSRAEVDRLAALCRDRRWALVADEVFADYPLDTKEPVTDLATFLDVLSFTLGGLSKSTGLPQLKLGWMVIGGPATDRRQAEEALELIADTYLSVGTPVQAAVGRVLQGGRRVREAIQQRLATNLAAAREAARAHPGCDILRTEGGWSIVIRVPATRSEEALALDLLEREGIVAHPGYFFDFEREAFLVVSLLPAPGVFADGIARLLAFASTAPEV
jgi:aspartate/methionine/tyrosine aminotransferase